MTDQGEAAKLADELETIPTTKIIDVEVWQPIISPRQRDIVLAALRVKPASPGEGGAEPDKGPWRVVDESEGPLIYSDDFTHDVTLRINGDFSDDAQKRQYAEGLVKKLNVAPPQAEQGTFHCKRHGDYPAVGPEDDPECPTCKLERKPQAERAKEPIVAHSKSEYRRMTAQGANVVQPADARTERDDRKLVSSIALSLARAEGIQEGHAAGFAEARWAAQEFPFTIGMAEITRIRNTGCGNEWPKVWNRMLNELCDAYEALRSIRALQPKEGGDEQA